MAKYDEIGVLMEEIKTKISAEIPVASDKQIIEQVPPQPILIEELPSAPDMEVVQEHPLATMSLDSLYEAPNTELKNVFIPFDGKWLPDNEPIEIGAKNFKTLQNYRYAGDEIIHLESVLGYSKINTTSLSTYNYENIRNGFQLRSEFTKKTYVLVHTEHDTVASNYSKVYQNQTAIPSQGDFVATALHTDSGYSLEGRFSDAPGGQVCYCNGEETCIWAGEEMRCAGFFSIYVPTVTATDIAFVDGGASADTIVSDAQNFIQAGFKAGQIITVSGSTSNNNSFRLVSISNDGLTLTLDTGVLTAEVKGDTVTVTVPTHYDYQKATDYTDRINNAINSAAEAAYVVGTTGYKWLVLSTRSLQGVKYALRTANGTGSATTTCKIWDGDSFEAVDTPSDGTDSGGSMKQSGTFSWNYSSSPVAKPLCFEGLYLYAYLFELSAGTTYIYQVTLDAPFQNAVDIWDGVYRQPISFQVSSGLSKGGGEVSGDSNGLIAQDVYEWIYGTGHILRLWSTTDYNNIKVGAVLTIVDWPDTVTVTHKLDSGYHIVIDSVYTQQSAWKAFTYENPYDPGTAKYKNYTLEVNEPSFADYPIGAVLDALDTYNHIIVMFEERMSAIWIEMIAGLVNTNTSVASVSYWNGTDYIGNPIVADTTGAGKSLNESGLISWNPPAEMSEFRKTEFGITGYAYKISFTGTLSGTAGGAHEVVIDTIKGIPAQNTVKPFKFSGQYSNRLMLCGYTQGKEGNRVDYSVSEAADVFNGDESSMDGIQSLYVGGKDDLTCGIELFNRFGSNIISSFLLFKNTETYLLTGDGPDNYRLYTISRTIGCPAPLTIAAAEVVFADGITRRVVIWMSYAGPMMFDGAAIMPIPGINKYFDPAKTARLETASIKRCRGWFDATYREYNLVIPSASGATNCTVWVFYDLVRKRWSEKKPGASEIPQAAWPVIDTDGKQYIYAGINDGNMMRLENGATWADDSATAMSPVIETGDFFPSGDLWHITTIRRVKTIVKKITEASKNLTTTHYKDTEATGTSLTAHNLDAGDPISKFTQAAPSGTPLFGWAHRFKFELSAGFVTETQFHPIGFGYQYLIERDDEYDI